MGGHWSRCSARALGFSAASVLSWVLVLVLLGFWLWRETGSRTAALVAVALAAQSPLVLETAWWYSASSFLWAIAGILVAILGPTYLSRRPVAALSMIGLGSALGLAGTTLGILAAPLAILRAVLDPTISRRLKVLVIMAAVSGVVTYRQVCKVGRSDGFSHQPALGASRASTLRAAWAMLCPCQGECSGRRSWASPFPGRSARWRHGSASAWAPWRWP